MDKVLIDTNILLDFFEAPRPEHQVAVAAVLAMAEKGVVTCLAATSLKDLYYVLCRHLDEPTARVAVKAVLETMTLLPVDDNCCRHALASSEPDFEDAIIRAAAEIAHVDYLISRDTHAFIGSTVPRVNARDILKML